jgi:uncharacterized membrane protein
MIRESKGGPEVEANEGQVIVWGRRRDVSVLPSLAGQAKSIGRRVMPEFMTNLTMRAGVSVVVLCVLILAGFYLVSIFRDYAAQDQAGSEQALANLLEMHRKGDISDEEFRTIESRTHRPPVGFNAIDDSTSSDDSSPNSQV